MKRVLILTKEKQVVDWMSVAVKAAGFEGKIDVVGSDISLLVRIAELDYHPPAAVFVDLSAVPESLRFVEWLTFSPRMRRLRFVALGEESLGLRAFSNGWGSQSVLTKPLQARAVMAVVENLNLGGDLAATRRTKLRGDQERLLQHLDLLAAELKDK